MIKVINNKPVDTDDMERIYEGEMGQDIMYHEATHTLYAYDSHDFYEITKDEAAAIVENTVIRRTERTRLIELDIIKEGDK